MSGKIKMKKHSGAAKRFKRTASGYKHRRAFRSHLLTDRSTKRKRKLRAMGRLHSHELRRARRMLGD